MIPTYIPMQYAHTQIRIFPIFSRFFFLLNFLEKNRGNLQNLQKLLAYFQEAGEQGQEKVFRRVFSTVKRVKQNPQVNFSSQNLGIEHDFFPPNEMEKQLSHGISNYYILQFFWIFFDPIKKNCTFRGAERTQSSLKTSLIHTLIFSHQRISLNWSRAFRQLMRLFSEHSTQVMHCNTIQQIPVWAIFLQSFAISDLEFESAGDFNQIPPATHRPKQLWLNPTPSQTDEFHRDLFNSAICCQSNALSCSALSGKEEMEMVSAETFRNWRS